MLSVFFPTLCLHRVIGVMLVFSIDVKTLIMSSVVEDFIHSSVALFDQCMKDQLLKVAGHFDNELTNTFVSECTGNHFMSPGGSMVLPCSRVVFGRKMICVTWGDWCVQSWDEYFGEK